MKLEIIREKIDLLDERLLHILASRLKLVQKVAQIKKKEEKPIEDKLREEFILHGVNSKAKKMHLSTKFVEDIYKIIFKESKKLQIKS